MIKLNNRDCEWQEGLTVEELMKLKNYTYSRIVVMVNAELGGCVVTEQKTGISNPLFTRCSFGT